MTTIALPNGLSARLDHCCNCGRLEPIICKGRCKSCYHYFYRHGYDRPADSIKPGYPRQRCDCGQPAKHRQPIWVGLATQRTMFLYLCDDCLKLEQTMNLI